MMDTKQKLFLALLISGTIAAFNSFPCHAAETNEAQLIAILQSSNSSPRQKADACAQLKRTGSKNSVPALAALLTDDQLSLSARYALGSMPAPEAGKALLQILPRTSGPIEVGIINSLAARGDTAAVPALGKLLSAADTNVAAASAEALGTISGSKALQLLQGAATASSDSVHRAEIDGILKCANRLLDAGKRGQALKVFEDICKTEKSDAIHLAAFRGVILASDKKKGIAQLAAALTGTDGPIQSAALQVAAQWRDPEVAKALIDILPNGTEPVQLALLQCLVQRRNSEAMPAVAQLAVHADAAVSTAAIAALGSLGDASMVGLLADSAASSTGAKRNAARQSLLELNRGPVTQRMMESLKTSAAPAESELIRALAGRGDRAAVPTLLGLAQNGNDNERGPALAAMGQLAGSAQIPQMVQLVADAYSDELRSGAADALNEIFQRVQTPGEKLDVSSFVSAVQTGSTDTRLALLPICSEVTQEPVRVALRSAVADSDTHIREAGLHTLCDSKDAELLPELLGLALDTNQTSLRLLAIRGCVRLTTQEDSVKLSNAAKLGTLNKILSTPLNTQEKQAVLSGLGAIADPESLKLAMELLGDDSVHAEAEQAIVNIATGIAADHPDDARSALKKVISETTNPDTKKSAQAALKKIK